MAVLFILREFLPEIFFFFRFDVRLRIRTRAIPLISQYTTYQTKASVKVYTIYIFQRSFVSLSTIKTPTVFSEVTITIQNASFLDASCNAVSFSAGTYWQVSPALSGVLLYTHIWPLQSFTQDYGLVSRFLNYCQVFT